MEKSGNALRIEIQRLKDLRTVADAGIGWMERAEAAEASLASLKREMEEKDARIRKERADAMVAHRWFAEQFGEVMNGRDFAVKCRMASEEVAALRAQLETERARFDWWFGPAAKDISEYLRGVREGWSIEQWRAWIDAAREPR